MGTAQISTGFLLTSLTVVVLLEWGLAQLGAWLPISRLGLIGLTRLIQLTAILSLVRLTVNEWGMLGLDRQAYVPGLKKGLIWSAGFAVIAGLLFLGLFIAGQHPFRLIRTALPTGPFQLGVFFFVGGMLAPIVEEIVFRGLLFGYLRRWGVTTAILVSTTLFAILHLPSLPITQIVGGAVFAVAYHLSGSLMTPIVIHMLGNLAIFTLSLPFWGTA